MSDEEKKELKELINLMYNNHISQYGKRKLEKYIEKQSKEIEELKQKEKKAYIDGTNAADKLCSKKWENKIKARIKELEEYLYKGNIKDDFLMIRIKAKIQELQSLLGEEQKNGKI